MTGKVGGVVPGGRNAGEFGDGGGDHDPSGYCDAESGR